MSDLEITDTTIRNGLTVDEIRIGLAGAEAVTGYLVRDDRPSDPRPITVAIHDENGDRSSLLPDLMALAAKGGIGLSIDCPNARAAMRDRDHLAAFDTLTVSAAAAIGAARRRDDVADERLALIGRGIGSEVAGHLATRIAACRVVVAEAPLPDRAEFLTDSSHGLALGFRLRVDEAERQNQTAGLASKSLVASMTAAPEPAWLLQIADDDDRLDEDDRRLLTFGISNTVRVGRYDTWFDLGRDAARQERIDLIHRLV